MHGRLKVKTTAEQQAEKKKEQKVKQEKYLTALKIVFSKREDKIYDKECLNITAQLLMANPDALSLWNYRREILLSFKENLEESVWQQMLKDELKVIEACLIKNHKSYGAWFHRDWVFQVIPSPPYSEELELCDQYLEKDERNFHCWDHRKTIVKISNQNLSKELDFTKNLIDKNFSNYSAWHYRSKLLPLVHEPSVNNPHPVPEDIFLKELDMVVTAIFTDPLDQSPWFFLRWLVSKKEEDPRLLQVGILPFNSTMKLVLVFSSFVSTCEGLSVCLDDKILPIENIAPHENKFIWFLPLEFSKGNHTFKINHKKWFPEEAVIELESDSFPVFKWINKELTYATHLSETAKNALQRIIDNCEALDQIEPGNKWVLFTLVNIMSALDVNSHKEKILEYLEQLQQVDYLRKKYYQDVRSKVVMEVAIQQFLERDSSVIDLSSQGISHLVLPQYLTSIEKIDLSWNKIQSIQAFTCLFNCRELILDGNKIPDLTPLTHVRQLKVLSMNTCGIDSINALKALKCNRKLQQLSLKGNTVTSIENFEAILKSLNSSLMRIET